MVFLWMTRLRGRATLLLTALVYGGKDQAANPDQSLQFKMNETSIGIHQWDGRTAYTATLSAPAQALLPGQNRLHLITALAQLPGIGDYWVYPDKIDVEYSALANAEDDTLEVAGLNTKGHSGEVVVSGFSNDAVRVYDVRDGRRPVRLTSTQTVSSPTGFDLHFWDAWAEDEQPRRYSIATSTALHVPLTVEYDRPSDLRSTRHEADYIAIVHDSLSDALQPLLDRRAQQGLRVIKVEVQEIYDEFNHGFLHQKAIRDFLSYAYHNWNQDGPPPRYVLLVGDGTYDPKNALSSPVPNLIPPFLINIDPWMGETAADNRYVSVDEPGDYLPDMAVGRITAWNPEQLAAVIDKIAAYEDGADTPGDPWQDQVVFVADNKDDAAGNFHQLSDTSRLSSLPTYYDSSTIYYRSDDSLDTGDEMRASIKQAFNDSAILLQWFGHGTTIRWGSVSMWNVYDVPTLAPKTNLPFLTSYTCYSGYFHKVTKTSSGSQSTYQTLGETHLLQPGRGAIADLSPSGLHVGGALEVLNRGLLQAIFQDRVARVGDATDAAKLFFFANSTAWHDVIDTMILFGDPALKLKLPLPPPEAPALTLYSGDGTVDLEWSHRYENTVYEVWRGTSPYFVPGSDGVQVGTVDAAGDAYAPGASVKFTDDGNTLSLPVAIRGDPAVNYTWIVRGANWRGVSSESNRVGEFDFTLMSGQP
jgi:hypothetical protein